MDVTRRIRTSPHTARRDPHDGGQQARLLARIIREVLRVERFEDFSDVKPAIKTRLRQLHIRYQPYELDDAISVVSAAGGFRFIRVLPRPIVVDVSVPPRSLSRAEARALWSQLVDRFGFREKTLSRVTSRIRIDGTNTDPVVDLESQLEALS